MKTVINYKAVDPYYSDHRQVFIGEDWVSIDNQIYEFEKYLGRNHPMGISAIYRREQQLEYKTHCAEKLNVQMLNNGEGYYGNPHMPIKGEPITESKVMMKNTVEKLLELVNDNKVSGIDCVSILTAMLEDEIAINSTNGGLTVKPMEQASRDTVKLLLQITDKKALYNLRAKLNERL